MSCGASSTLLPAICLCAGSGTSNCAGPGTSLYSGRASWRCRYCSLMHSAGSTGGCESWSRVFFNPTWSKPPPRADSCNNANFCQFFLGFKHAPIPEIHILASERYKVFNSNEVKASHKIDGSIQCSPTLPRRSPLIEFNSHSAKEVRLQDQNARIIS